MRTSARYAVLIFTIIVCGCGYKLVRHGQLNQPYFEQIVQRVSAERELPWLTPVDVRIIDRADVRGVFEDEMNKEYPPEKIAGLERAYIRMGLIDPGTNLRETLLHFISGASAGMYTPEKKALFIVKDAAGQFSLTGAITKRDTAAELVIAHELDHALDDQHFDLLKLDKATEGNDDAAIALSAVEEGSATIVGLAVIYRPGMTMDDVFLSAFSFNTLNAKLIGILNSSTPSTIREMLLFGYDAGSRFVSALYHERGGWNGVNEAFKNPPLSSEQVMHPEKYLNGLDLPRNPILKFAASDMGTGWMEADRNVAGEFGIQVLLKRFVPKPEAITASEGWGGDSYVVVEGPGAVQVIWVWSTVWDSEADAVEFERAYIDLLPKKYSKLQSIDPGSGGARMWDTATSGFVWMRRVGNGVIIIEGVDREQLCAIIAKLE